MYTITVPFGEGWLESEEVKRPRVAGAGHGILIPGWRFHGFEIGDYIMLEFI
jgi:hypothetical protein